MWKTARSLLVVALIAIPVSDGFAADQPDFTLCKSTYALCLARRLQDRRIQSPAPAT
jgi:hypothetical protein